MLVLAFGLDGRGTLRAIVGTSGGAGTLTQQLAKQLFTEKDLNSCLLECKKIKEWIIAIIRKTIYKK
jgi:penicillin-binding protein 1A